MNSITLSFLSLFLFNVSVKAQSHHVNDSLYSLVGNTLRLKSHLTILFSTGNPVQIDSNVISIKVSFHNENLQTNWYPEVAVQYIFDDALSFVADTIWNEKDAKQWRFKRIRFIVDIAPHDIPPVITFEINSHDWETFVKHPNKEALYKKMKVTTRGETFQFNAHEAAGIE